jgi:hypothetical protein
MPIIKAQDSGQDRRNYQRSWHEVPAQPIVFDRIPEKPRRTLKQDPFFAGTSHKSRGHLSVCPHPFVFVSVRQKSLGTNLNEVPCKNAALIAAFDVSFPLSLFRGVQLAGRCQDRHDSEFFVVAHFVF